MGAAANKHYLPANAQHTFFVITDLDTWEAMPFAVHSPLHIAVAASPGAWPPGGDVKVAASSELGPQPLAAVATGPVEPLLTVAIKQACQGLKLPYLQTLCDYLGLKAGTTWCATMSVLIKAKLPHTTDDALLDILKQGHLRSESSMDLSEHLDDDTVMETFNAKDLPEVRQELKKLETKKSEDNIMLQEYREFTKSLLGKKYAPRVKAAAKALAKKATVKLTDLKFSGDDVPQSEAKKILPGGAYIWRGNYAGSWQVHAPPHARHTEAWHHHGNSRYKAMLAAARHAWRLYLDDRDLDTSQCTVEGLF